MAKTKKEIQRAYENRTGYAAQAKYEKEKTTTVLIRLHIINDADIIERLINAESKNGYIKQLIRSDINKTE